MYAIRSYYGLAPGAMRSSSVIRPESLSTSSVLVSIPGNDKAIVEFLNA